MFKVFKYPVKIGDRFSLELPRSARVLSVAEQNQSVNLWALVDPDESTETRNFVMAGTGHPINLPEQKLKFINTILMMGGSLVFHFFEIIE